MKYTIELTNKQKHRFEYMCKRATKWGLGFIPVLEPMEVKAVNVEDTNDYKIGYNVGFEDGKKQGYDNGYEDGYNKCLHSSATDDYQKGKADGYKLGVADGKSIMQTVPEDLLKKERQDGYNQGFEDGKNDAVYNTELIDELKQREYNRGLEDAWKLAQKLVEVYQCNLPMKKELLYNSLQGCIANNDYYTVSECVKAYEEKKKAEEETVKVGDVVECMDAHMIVTRINPITKTISGVSKDGEFFDRDMTKWHKTGKHYDIESILKELEE